jgi:hypothetical protein
MIGHTSAMLSMIFFVSCKAMPSVEMIVAAGASVVLFKRETLASTVSMKRLKLSSDSGMRDKPIFIFDAIPVAFSFSRSTVMSNRLSFRRECKQEMC